MLLLDGAAVRARAVGEQKQPLEIRHQSREGDAEAHAGAIRAARIATQPAQPETRGPARQQTQ